MKPTIDLLFETGLEKVQGPLVGGYSSVLVGSVSESPEDSRPLYTMFCHLLACELVSATSKLVFFGCVDPRHERSKPWAAEYGKCQENNRTFVTGEISPDELRGLGCFPVLQGDYGLHVIAYQPGSPNPTVVELKRHIDLCPQPVSPMRFVDSLGRLGFFDADGISTVVYDSVFICLPGGGHGQSYKFYTRDQELDGLVRVAVNCAKVLGMVVHTYTTGDVLPLDSF